MSTFEHEDLIRSENDEFHLACLLLSPTAVVYLGQALDDVDPGDFYDPVLGQMWADARVIHARGSRVTARALLAAAETGATAPAPRIPVRSVALWLERVSGEPVYPQRLPASARAVKDSARLRRLVQAAERMKQGALVSESYSGALEGAWEALRALEGSEVPPEVVPFAVLLDEWHKQMAGGLVVGEVVPSPWPELNEFLSGGFHPGRSYLVAARPGLGKTTSGLNVAAHAAEQGLSALVVSQEMSRFEVTGKVLAAGGQAEYGEIVRYAMSEDTAYRVTEYGESHRDMPLRVIDTPGLTIEYISAVAKTVKRSHGLDLLFVDYLQLVEPTTRKVVREQQVAHISRTLKLLAKELDCAVLTAAQLSRDNVKSNRPPILADLRESGTLEQDSDAVILLHHPTTDDDRPTGNVNLIIAKNRFGRTGEVELRWRGHQARIG